MEQKPHPARALIEPAADFTNGKSWTPNEHEIELSKAISLKRIADALEAVGKWDGADNGLSMNLLDIAYRAGEAFENGKRRAS